MIRTVFGLIIKIPKIPKFSYQPPYFYIIILYFFSFKLIIIFVGNNSYVNQNQPQQNTGYNQNQMPTPQGNFMQGTQPMGSDMMGGPNNMMNSNMVGQPPTSQNQPPMGQMPYQSYPQTGYNPPQNTGQEVLPSMNPMASGQGKHSMGNGVDMVQQNQYAHPGGMNAQPFQTSQEENKTYNPGMMVQQPVMPPTDSLRDQLPLSPEVMKEFEEKAARCKQYKQTDVFAAILLKNEEDSIRVIEYLAKKGVSLTAVDTLEQTALFYASRDGKLKVLNMLLDSGCDPNHRDQYGQTAIYYAARENQLEIAQRLLEFGIDINNEDMHQQT